jgi:hypothetical protein
VLAVPQLAEPAKMHHGLRPATFVQAEGLSVGVRAFGPFRAYGSTYFVCVSQAVPAQVTL